MGLMPFATAPLATVFVGSAALRDRRPWLAAMIVSLLLHAAATWWLLGAPWWREAAPEPQPMIIEMVTVAPPEPAPPAEPSPPRLPVVPPPPPPQLSEAPIAERSTPPPVPRPAPQPARPRVEPATPAPAPAPRSTASVPPAESAESAPLEAGRVRPGGSLPEAIATQTVQDVILRQIARHWIIDVRGPTYRDVVLSMRFKLLPDGMLAPPFGRNDPWDLRVMVRDYEMMMRPENRMIRTTIETFLQAMRQAQPFQLPPDGQSAEVRTLPLSFRLGDL